MSYILEVKSRSKVSIETLIPVSNERYLLICIVRSAVPPPITGLSNEEDAWKTWSTVEGDFASSNINTTITEIATETFPEYYTLAFDVNEEAKSLKVTGEHPVLVKRKEFVAFIQVAEIVAGDSIRYFPNNSWSVLTSVVKTTGNTIPTYNLGAENSDNYFANGVVVHNAANQEKR